MASHAEERQVVKPLAELLNKWHAPDDGYGCPNCDKGLVGGFTLISKSNLPLFTQVLTRYWEGELKFCHCKRGTLYLKWCRDMSKEERRENA